MTPIDALPMPPMSPPTLLPTLAQAGSLFLHGGLAAAGAAAVSIPIIIHLLSRWRRTPQLWAAMRFLLEAYRKQKRRLQLEQLILLIVRCLVVLLLGLALAQPLLRGLEQQVGFKSAGRLIVIVLDHSLSSRTMAGGQTRFDGLREQAIELLDTLRPNDRVAVWLAGRPSTGLVSSPTTDHGFVRDRLLNLSPSFARSELEAALVEAANLAGADRTVPHAYIVVLSDFAAHTLDPDRTLPPELAALGDRVTIVTSKPAPAMKNQQVAAIRPQRHMSLVGARNEVRIALELDVKRFADTDAAAQSSVEVWATDTNGESVGPRQTLPIKWASGQEEAKPRTELPINVEPLRAAAGAEAASMQVQLHAKLPGDALPADDTRWAVLELRRRLDVGLVDSESGLATSDELTPRRWVTLALAPMTTLEGGAIEVQALAAEHLSKSNTAGLSALVVLRPDLLRDTGWRAVADLAKRGGLVWLVAPADDAPALWAQSLRTGLGLDWRVGLNVVEHSGEADGAGAASGPGSGDVTRGWRLAVNPAPPPALEILATDWNDLLRPIEVYRRLKLTSGGGADVWLATAPPDASPIVVRQRVGDGVVLLLATAIDPRWTNLATKPLFVPLLHESLRSLLGQSQRQQRMANLVSGDRPTLTSPWVEAQALADPSGAVVRLRRLGSSEAVANEAQPVEPLGTPGVYTATPGLSHQLAVNVDATAGNTDALGEQRLEAWLDRLGEWRWFDQAKPAASLRVGEQQSAVGWWVLWAVLALVMLETYLARWFSHAQSGEPFWRKLFERLHEEEPA